MRDRNWDRWGAVAGLVMVAAFVVAVLITGAPPKPTDADQVFKQFLVDKRDQLLTQGWLLGVAAGMFLWFAAAVRSVLRRAEGDTGHLANLFFGTAVANAALIVTSFTVGMAAVYKVAETSPASFARFVFDFGAMTTSVLGILAAIGAVAFAAVVLSTDVLARWTGWLALLSAAGSVIGSFLIFGKTGAFSLEGTAGFLPLGLFVVWAAGTAIAMLQKLGAPDTKGA
jgi:hypothetical protein